MLSGDPLGDSWKKISGDASLRKTRTPLREWQRAGCFSHQ
jgi:hypothetical protein